MSDITMINIVEYPNLYRHLSTLKETSKDDHDGSVCFMTESTIPAVNFDAVKTEYVNNLSISNIPKSNDALVIDSNEQATFIEFKNGCMDTKKQHGVRKKIYDSMLIFADITGQGISSTRTHMDYILVYNEEKNIEQCTDVTVDASVAIQPSESRDIIGKKITQMGGKNFIKFGLEVFKNYCFRNVYTYTPSEFESNYVQTYQA